MRRLSKALVTLGPCVAVLLMLGCSPSGPGTEAAVTDTCHDNLYNVLFVDDQHGWAVGDNGVILSTLDAGASWTAQASGTDVSLWVLGGLDCTLANDTHLEEGDWHRFGTATVSGDGSRIEGDPLPCLNWVGYGVF